MRQSPLVETKQTEVRDVYVSAPWSFEREVARLNKKAAKIGVSPIRLTNLGKTTRTRVVVLKGEDGESEASILVDVTHYQLEAPEAADRSWKLLAKITHVEDKPFVEPIEPGFDVEPWKSADAQHCDHCHVRRVRHLVYICRNTVDGRVIQLGSKCFEDYIGKDTLRALEFRAVVISNLGGDEEGFFPGSHGVGQIQAIPTRDCVAYAEFLNRTEGWQNNQKNQYGDWIVEGTHRVAAHRVKRAYDCSGDARRLILDVITVEDYAAADAAIERLRALNGEANTEEFLVALKNVADYDNIPAQKASLAAYIGQYLRQVDQKAAEAVKNATRAYRGTVGQRGDFLDLVCTRSHSFESQFGVTFINVFEDPDGNILVWKTGSREFATGDKVALKGTVKAHEAYRDTKQTILTRCKEL